MSISKSLRFKIFEKDNFTCQYCGRKPPQVILHIDHIHPKSKGGTDDEINLTTSCQDCNLGKRDKIIKNPKTKKEIIQVLENAKESEEQLNEYYKYLKKKEKKYNKIINEISDYWSELWNYEYSLNNRGKLSIKKFLTFLEPEEIKESMDIATCKISNVEECFKYFCGVVYTKKRNKYEQK